MGQILTEREWRTLCELLDKLADSSEGTWRDRKAELERRMGELGLETALEEFSGWFLD
jgi:hypothetical protein